MFEYLSDLNVHSNHLGIVLHVGSDSAGLGGAQDSAFQKFSVMSCCWARDYPLRARPRQASACVSLSRSCEVRVQLQLLGFDSSVSAGAGVGVA